jgi:hypothetical protein
MMDVFGVPETDLAPHLAALHAALARMAGCALPGPARLALAEAQEALTALENHNRSDMDRSVFDALLEMAGPEVAPELVAQMSADLRAVAMALSGGLSILDLAEIRAQTHVLVALAGAAGAHGLEAACQQLNRAAHVPDLGAVERLGPPVLTGLETLVAFVDRACDGRGSDVDADTGPDG